MTIVYFYHNDLCQHINYMFYTKKEVLRLAKNYGIENGYHDIYIPDYQLFLTRHGKRWFQ